MSKNTDIARSYTDSELNTLFAPLASPTFTGTPTLNGEALVKLSSDGLRIEKSNDASIKNQCTAWVNFDGTTTPPTIRDSYNVSSVVRTTTGQFEIYFTTPMDNINYSGSGTHCYFSNYTGGVYFETPINTLTKAKVYTGTVGSWVNANTNSIQIFGGKL